MPLSRILRRLSEPRSQYRVVHTDSPVVVHMVDGDGDLLEVDLVDSSAGGLRFRFREDVWPADEGSEILLRLCARDSTHDVDVPCEVVHMVDEGDAPPDVGVRFLDVKRFYDEADPRLWHVFNRRASYRVSPRDDAPIDVTVSRGDECFAAALVDVSTGGVGLMLPPDALADVEEVDLEIPLPTADAPVHVRARVRFRTPTPKGDRTGFQFLLEESDCPEAITDFVMLRQREMKQDPAR